LSKLRLVSCDSSGWRQENDPDQGWRDELVRVALITGEVRGKRLVA
jgi:hypothetical protein